MTFQRMFNYCFLLGALSLLLCTLFYNMVNTFPERISPKPATKQFLYMTMVRDCLRDYHLSNDSLESGIGFDVLVLSYRQPCNAVSASHITYIFPKEKTTWTIGRNLLHRHSMTHEKFKSIAYEYYIHFDGDINIIDNHDIIKNPQKYTEEMRQFANHKTSPWRKFESFLLYYKPAIGTVENLEQHVRISKFVGHKNIKPYYSQMNYDAQFNAFHRTTVATMLPYDDRYETRSLWISQVINMCRAYFRYNGHVIIFMPIVAWNTEHTVYASGFPLAVSEACKEEIDKAPAVMKLHTDQLYKTMITSTFYLMPKVYDFLVPSNASIKEYRYYKGSVLQ